MQGGLQFLDQHPPVESVNEVVTDLEEKRPTHAVDVNLGIVVVTKQARAE